jgi:ornithine cyclodeaminase/alanine dehydrogenase
MTLTLDHGDVASLLTMEAAIEVIEQATLAQHAGEAILVERSNLILPEGWMRMAPAALLHRGITGYKEFHLSPSREVRFEIRLFEYESGRSLAAMDGRLITAMRTGASGGVAIRRCTEPGAGIVGVLGSGESAASQLEADVAVRPVASAKVFSRSAENRERFAQDMADRHGIAVTAVDHPEKAVSDVELLLVATDTGGEGPALLGEWLQPGVHINSIGSTLPAQREVDERTFEVADRIIVDTLGVLRDSGDAIAAREAGTYHDDRVIELADLVGQAGLEVREPGAITLYKSIGTAIQDVAVAHWVYEQATRHGTGTAVRDHVSPKPD